VTTPYADPRVERLIGHVEDLCAVVRQLVATTPQRSKQWLEPRELATLLGVSTRTLASWRAAGRFEPESLRKGSKGWQFHRDHALRCVQRGMR